VIEAAPLADADVPDPGRALGVDVAWHGALDGTSAPPQSHRQPAPILRARSTHLPDPAPSSDGTPDHFSLT